jgi:muramoyltetrapeptide carboxypeptidase
MQSNLENLTSDIQFPPALRSGDRLSVVATSGALKSPETWQKGVDIWRQRGYQVEVCPGSDRQWGYLAGTDANRRQQLTDTWSDRHCAGMLCARGGYGGARLLENWRWPVDNSGQLNPKWLIGFSDITALLWSLYQQGIGAVHGPLLTTISGEPDWSVQRLFDLVEGRPLEPLQGVGWGGGKVTGRLLPANLTVATHLLQTPVQPRLDGTILAFEDVGEAPYRIDRMLTHWRMLGAFSGVRGIALGRFSQCDNLAKSPSFTVTEVLRDRLSDLDIPIVSDLPFGHDGVNAALPVGATVELDGDRGRLSF